MTSQQNLVVISRNTIYPNMVSNGKKQLRISRVYLIFTEQYNALSVSTLIGDSIQSGLMKNNNVVVEILRFEHVQHNMVS